MKASAKAATPGGQSQKQGTRQRAVQARLHGEVIEWKGAYGWIRPDEKISHAEAKKHGARVYVNREDVRKDVYLYEGARVVFYAYADGDGIGAEKVTWEPEAPAEPIQQNGTSGNTAPAAEKRIPGMPPPAAAERRIPGMPPPATKSRRARAAASTEGTAGATGAARTVASANSAASGSAASTSRSTGAAVAPSAVPSGAKDVALSAAPSGEPRSAPTSAVSGNSASSMLGGYPAGGANTIRDAHVSNTQSAAMSPAITSPYRAGDFAEADAGHLISPAGTGNDGAYSCESSVAALAADVAAAVLDDQLLDEQPQTNGSLEAKWWQCLAGDCCAISLDPLEELTCEPFGLFGITDGDGEPPHQGVWGLQAAEMVSRRSHQNVHWFNGMFLASFLVSSSQLIDPVNRRQLTRGECISLDNYLAAHQLPAVHVTDVYDLQQAVSGSVSTGATDRIRALELEAASMLRSLFDFRSSRSRPPPPPPRPGGPAPRPPQGPGACRQLPKDESEWPTPLPFGAGRADAGLGDAGAMRYTQRRVHEEGGLTVVDDGEFDEVWGSTASAAPCLAAGSEPTPAEALAFNRGGASRPPKAAYPSRGAMGAAAGGLPGGHIALASKSGNNEVAQVSFTVTGGARGARSTASSSRASGAGGATSNAMAYGADVSTTSSCLPACDVWVPDWAAPELHQRTLQELQAVEAMYSGAYRLRSPDVYAHLRDCVHRNAVSTQVEPLCFEVRQHVSGAGISVECVLEFSLPPYYPVHSASVVVRDATAVSCDVWMGRAVLDRVGQVMREEVVAPLEGTEVVLRVLEWFAQRGAGEIFRCSQQVAAEQAAAAAPAARGAAAAAEVESKQERVEQARKDRMMSKYSESWDICNAFKKHGYCNAKNCQWRHELPTNNRTWS